MSKSHVEALKHSGKLARDLYKECPEVMGAFSKVHGASLKEGALSTKTKELMSVAISVIVRCNGCIDAHVSAAIKAGATREEISESVGVAILMGGGPATAYGALAIEAMNQFLSEE